MKKSTMLMLAVLLVFLITIALTMLAIIPMMYEENEVVPFLWSAVLWLQGVYLWIGENFGSNPRLTWIPSVIIFFIFGVYMIAKFKFESAYFEEKDIEKELREQKLKEESENKAS